MIRQFQSKFEVLKREEFNDLLQECLTHWFFKRDQYDPSKPALCKTFMKRIVANKLMDIAKLHERQKRKISQRSIPLDDLIFEEGEDSCLAVDDENIEAVLKSDKNQILLTALEKLSLRQKELCRLLKEEGLSLNQAGEKLGLPRATVYDEILRIREVFKKEGLKDYL